MYKMWVIGSPFRPMHPTGRLIDDLKVDWASRANREFHQGTKVLDGSAPHFMMWAGAARQSSGMKKKDAKEEGSPEGGSQDDRVEKGEKGRDDDKAELNGKAITLKLYIMKRRFDFLHLYSGPHDPLGTAIQSAAKKHKMKVTVTSSDKVLNNADLGRSWRKRRRDYGMGIIPASLAPPSQN